MGSPRMWAGWESLSRCACVCEGRVACTPVRAGGGPQPGVSDALAMIAERLSVAEQAACGRPASSGSRLLHGVTTRSVQHLRSSVAC